MLPSSMRTVRAAAVLALSGVSSHAVAAAPGGATPEAWWTGPILASSGGTLPRGHALVEPYLFDARGHGYDYAGSLTYLLYGVTDRLTVGVIPTFGSGHSVRSEHRRRVGIGDITAQVQYRIHQAAPGELIPTWSLVVQEVLPSARFDRLKGDGDRGIGTGARATILGLYAQRLDVLATGRPLRTRLNLTYSLPVHARVRDESVYGTPPGFRGRVRPGHAWFADLSVEYSLDRNWVLASDLFVHGAGTTSVAGSIAANGGYLRKVPAQSGVGIAPAVEYSWTSSRGVLLGVRRIFPGRNVGGTWTPVVAFNAYL